MSINPADMPNKACKFCVHCKRTEKGGIYQCRYNPPRAGGFPLVKWNDWCRCYAPDESYIKKHLDQKAKEKQRFEEVKKSLERKG